MVTDPTIVPCPLCGARSGEPCVRLTSYGAGAALRRAHRQRYTAADEHRAGWSR